MGSKVPTYTMLATAMNEETEDRLTIDPRLVPRAGSVALTCLSSCFFMAADIRLVNRKVPLTLTSSKLVKMAHIIVGRRCTIAHPSVSILAVTCEARVVILARNQP